MYQLPKPVQLQIIELAAIIVERQAKNDAMEELDLFGLCLSESDSLEDPPTN